MKKTIQAFITVFVASTFMFSSGCKKAEQGPKGEPGPTGAQGSAAAAKTYTFNMTFNPGDTYQQCNWITDTGMDDVIVTYLETEYLGGQSFWTQLPYDAGSVYVYPQFIMGTNGAVLAINTVKPDRSAGSPWTSSGEPHFKAVLIKGSKRLKNVDLSDYQAVKKAYHLTD